MLRTMTGQRLTYWGKVPDASFWTRHWHGHLPKADFSASLKGQLGKFERLFTAYLPREGRILEAGCGTGQLVIALRQRGWDVEGVDFCKETVQLVRERFPDLPIDAGDVTRLTVPDGYYQGYISIGVMEHDQSGPDAFLGEAHRVLADGGVAMISVPTMHPLRRIKAKLGCYRRSNPDGLPFYQYAFPRDEFSALIRRAGLEVIATHPYSGFKGIKDELPGSRPVLELMRRIPLLRRAVRWWLDRSRFGHMMMYVCRKRARE